MKSKAPFVVSYLYLKSDPFFFFNLFKSDLWFVHCIPEKSQKDRHTFARTEVYPKPIFTQKWYLFI